MANDKAAVKKPERVSLSRKLASEWKMIVKPKHVFKDSIYVIVSSIIGAGITAMIDLGVGRVISMIAGM